MMNGFMGIASAIAVCVAIKEDVVSDFMVQEIWFISLGLIINWCISC